MVAYASAAIDMEMGPEERTVVLLEKKPSSGWMWKVSGVLLVLALCLGGVMLFGWFWSRGPEMTTQAGQSQAQTEKHTAEKTDPHSTLRHMSSKAKAAIHLEGSYEEDSLTKQVEWRIGQGQAFSQGGFRLENNRIVVPESGLYFVYSQASFRVSCSEHQGDTEDEDRRAGRHSTPLSHRIWRYSDSIGDNASLMSAVRSVCQDSGQEQGAYRAGRGWYNTIYLGAVFQLNSGDTLWTEINQPSQLETDDGKTFFGVFAL